MGLVRLGGRSLLPGAEGDGRPCATILIIVVDRVVEGGPAVWPVSVCGMSCRNKTGVVQGHLDY